MLKDELVKLANDYDYLYEKVDGFCGVGYIGGQLYIQLLKSTFDEMFPNESVEYYGEEESDYYRKCVEYDEVVFMCLIEKEEYEEHCNEEV